MPAIVITESQFEVIRKQILESKTLTEEEKKILLNEKWYNTAMDFLGIIDPTPITDTINAISYFTQGEMLFGVLSLISAIPLFGDVVGKSLMGTAKIGSKSTRLVDDAFKLMKKAPVGSKQYKLAQEAIEKVAQQPGVMGKFIQKMGSGTGDTIIRTLDDLPLGPFNGLKNVMTDYVKILGNAGKKSVGFQAKAASLASKFKKGAAVADDVLDLKNFLKTTKVFDIATLSKPGFFGQVFYGGIPRLFRSPEGRRIKILMGQTKWWLGFLDYIGLGNWVGPEEVSKKMGDEQFMKKLEEYQKTSQAKQNFDDQFEGEAPPVAPTQTTPSKDNSVPYIGPKKDNGGPSIDPLAGFFKSLLMGKLNPIPGM